MFDHISDNNDTKNTTVTNGTKLAFEADYELGHSLLGKTIDRLRVKKEVEIGIERSCTAIKQYIESGKNANQTASEKKTN